MPNIQTLFETTVNILHSLTDDHKPPLHIGEAMACWTYQAFVEEIIAYEQVALNMTDDHEFQDTVKHSLEVAKSHHHKLSEFMREEGIPSPTQPQSKPNSQPNAVPLGAKFTDSELANALSINFVVAGDMCATAASQSLRTDVGLMFLQFQMDKLALGFKMKNLMQKRGWLKIPPAYKPPGLRQ